MRFICFLFTTLSIGVFLLFGFVSCTSSDNVVVDPLSESFEIIKTRYGAEEVIGIVTKECTAKSISTADMLVVLKALQKSSLQKKKCTVESSDCGYFGGGKSESGKKIIMCEQYNPETNYGNILSDFILRVELSFNIENNQVYYLGTDYLYDSDLFEWRANGLSLFPAKYSNGCTYEFESESFLFFKLNDRGNSLVKVPVIFKGKYDFDSNEGTYNFELQVQN